jgi:hypothetical protein
VPHSSLRLLWLFCEFLGGGGPACSLWCQSGAMSVVVRWIGEGRMGGDVHVVPALGKASGCWQQGCSSSCCLPPAACCYPWSRPAGAQVHHRL